MKMKCNLIRVFVLRWFLLKLCLLMKNADLRCWMKCWLKCWSKCWLAIWWNFSRAASNADTSNALADFPILSKNCTWLWNDQMHWRIFDEVRKAAPWWSNALTNFRFCQKTAPDAETIKCIDGFSILSEGCTWLWNSQMHWRIDYDLAVSATDVVARFWLFDDADRPSGK